MGNRPMVQNTVDAIPHVGVVATLTGWLPPVAAVVSIVWIAIQIAEKISGQPFHKLIAPLWERIKRLCS